MWRRGADLDGNVANFVESEQILESQGFFASYTQVRGSIPVMWEQVVDLSYKPQIKTVNYENTPIAVERHFRDLRKRYGDILAIDLINQQGGESVLSVAYREAMEKLSDEHIRSVDLNTLLTNSLCSYCSVLIIIVNCRPVASTHGNRFFSFLLKIQNFPLSFQ